MKSKKFKRQHEFKSVVFCSNKNNNNNMIEIKPTSTSSAVTVRTSNSCVFLKNSVALIRRLKWRLTNTYRSRKLLIRPNHEQRGNNRNY